MAALLGCAAHAHSVEAGGVTLSWTLVDGVVHGEVSAPATGWVGVGFNDREALAGSVLLLGYADGDRVVVEEHVAQPPEHPPRTSLGGVAGLGEYSVVEADGRTTMTFQWALDTGDSLLSLRPDQRVWLTLAYSNHDDLSHHSAMRTARWVDLSGE